jgi:hypothetical protein
MRAKQTTGEVWLAAFRIAGGRIRYRAVYSHNPINPLKVLEMAIDQFKIRTEALFLRVPTELNPSVMFVDTTTVWKSDDPIQVLSALHEFGMRDLVTMPNGVEVEG